MRRAEEKVAMLEEDLVELSLKLEEKVSDLAGKYAVDNYEVETFTIKPRRSDLFDGRMSLLWEMVPPPAQRG